MPAKLSGQIKTSVIKKSRKDGDTYIFERRTIYDPEKKCAKILCTKLIAGIPKGSEIPVPICPKHGKKGNCIMIAIGHCHLKTRRLPCGKTNHFRTWDICDL